MKELSEELLFNEFLRLLTREEAYKRIKKIFKPKVTRKEIFDFNINLRTIVEDSPSEEDQEEVDERERKYIEHWLKSKGVKVEE